jgi:YD repeat-containing protein
MRVSRRGLLSKAIAPVLAASPLFLTSRASADSAQYLYDPLGRLVRVTLPDGTVVMYDYDAAGNRVRQVRGSGTAPFNQTLQITGTGPVNLRTVADQAGYTGLTNASIIFQIGAAVTIIGASGTPQNGAGGPGLDTGLWPSSTKTISLTLEVSGKVYGGGGVGGGGPGGHAIYCQENISITVNSGGQVKGGGGGGGMGGGWQVSGVDGEGMPWGPEYREGGGGGGGFPNGAGGQSVGPGGSGAAGTTSGGGAGGSGHNVPGGGGGRTVGAGGAGGGAAASGATGANATGTAGGNQFMTFVGPDPGLAGGAGGYAVRKNGKTVPVTNNGTVTGTVG